MAIYRPTSGTGAWTNPSSAYDVTSGTTGNRTTSSYGTAAGVTTAAETWSWTTSLTGVTAVTLYVSYQLYCYDWNDNSGISGVRGNVSISYSHNGGTNYYTLASNTAGGVTGSGSTGYASFNLTNLPTNLTSLRFKASLRGGSFYDGETNYDGSSEGYIYDVYADVNPITARPNTSCDPFIFF